MNIVSTLVLILLVLPVMALVVILAFELDYLIFGIVAKAARSVGRLYRSAFRFVLAVGRRLDKPVFERSSFRPRRVRVRPGDCKITVRWDRPEHEAVDSYTVVQSLDNRLDQSDPVATVGPQTCEAVLTSLTNGRTYFIWVYATRGEKISTMIGPIAVTPAPPGYAERYNNVHTLCGRGWLLVLEETTGAAIQPVQAAAAAQPVVAQREVQAVDGGDVIAVINILAEVPGQQPPDPVVRPVPPPAPAAMPVAVATARQDGTVGTCQCGWPVKLGEDTYCCQNPLCLRQYVLNQQGRLMHIGSLRYGVCQCCRPRGIVVNQAGQDVLVCATTGKPHAVYPGGGTVLVDSLPFGVCICCTPRSPLVNNGRNIMCSSTREPYELRGGTYVKIGHRAVTDVEDITEMLNQGAVTVGPNGTIIGPQ